MYEILDELPMPAVGLAELLLGRRVLVLRMLLRRRRLSRALAPAGLRINTQGGFAPVPLLVDALVRRPAAGQSAPR